jgi:Antirestriction protein
MMIFEEDLYTHMSQLCADYSGGYWNFYDLNNGGCYLAPSGAQSYRLTVSGNGFEGCLSADAAGITATLFAINTLTFRFPHLRQHIDRYYQLRDFACTHAEAPLIMAAID